VNRRRLIILTVLLLLLVPAGGVWWLLHTESGANRLLSIARGATAEALSYDSVSGSLASGLVVTSLRFETDGATIDIARLYAELRLSVLPLGVHIDAARIESLGVSLSDTGEQPESEFEPESLLASLNLPLEITAGSLVVSPVDVQSNGEALFHADRVAVSLAWTDTIELRAFEIDGGEEFGLAGGMSLGLTQPFALSADVDARAGSGLTRLPDPLSASLVLAGDLDALQVELVEATSALRLQGEIEALLRKPAWDLKANLRELKLTDSLGIGGVELGSAGTPDGFDVESSVSVSGLIDELPARVTLEADGSTTGFDIKALTVEHPALQVVSSGRVDIPFGYRGNVELTRLALNHWVSGLTKPNIVSGQADLLVTPERLSIETAQFTVAESDAGVDVSGDVDLQSGTVDAVLAWHDLRWPLVGDATQVESREGRATVAGTIDEWRTELSARLAAPGIPEGLLVAKGQGTRTTAAVDIVEGEVFGGSVAGGATVDWGRDLRWSAEAGVNGLRTGVLLPGYPGVLTLDVRGDGGASGGNVELVDLRGALLGQPVRGGGTLALFPGSVVARNFEISHGDASVSLNGELYAAEGLDFDVRLPNLALYRPALAGDLDVGGRLSLKPDAPTLDLVASSSELRAGAVALTGLDVRTTENDARGIDLAIDAEALALGDRRIDTIDIDAMINPDRQRLSVGMVPLGSSVTIVADGAMQEPGSLTAFPWTGELLEFRLVTPKGEGGGLDSPAKLELSPERILVDGLCLSGDLRGSLCAALDYDRATGTTLDGSLDGFPIEVLNAFLQTGFEFQQTLSGELSLNKPVDAGATAAADLRFSAGKIASVRFPELELETGDGVVSFGMADGQLLSGEIDLPIGPQGFVEGTFKVVDMAMGANSPIEGAFRARTRDIDVLMVPVPDVDGAEGTIAADLEFSGTLGAPYAIGTASLTDGRINYFPLGLSLTDINVSGRFDESQHINLNGTFRAGSGTGEITTQTGTGDAGEAGIHIGVRGTGLEVVNLPDISAVSDTDLTLDYRSGRLDINGSVDFPSARIRPVNLVTSRVVESEDVVIVAGELPDEPEDEGKAAGPLIFGKLAVGMGDDVQVILDVATATISGSTDFEWSGDPVPTGRGRYNVNGTVEAFGQVLDISEGRVSFPGVPATEPILDIRATRDIFGNTQVKQAGVLVQGSVQRPTIEAYTVPITTEERALTLLVTGNDFDYEQGVGAIDFGTYIAPRLFLSYGVGVFERENIVTARYDLTTGFGIRATSGSRASGVDLTYRLER
jgi:translocation and assembly module TamB